MRSPINWVVALDGGTTNTRARLLKDGNVIATARHAVGVRDSVLSPGSTNSLAFAVREAIAEVLSAGACERPDAIVAAGMLTSDVGLRSVPHATAPAGLDELAALSRVVSIPEVSPWPILLVPGVRTPAGSGEDGWAEADVMRGEECETLGALSLCGLSGPVAMVWPGSHTKLVEVDAEGRIARSQTTLAGEFLSAVSRHTLISASMPLKLPEEPDPSSIALGTRLAEREGLGRCAFLVRVAALTGALDAEQRASFWIGAVVADDARNLARHEILANRSHVVVGGGQPLRGLYGARLTDLVQGPVNVLSNEEAERVSAIGALAVLQRFVETRASALNPG